MSTPAPAPDHYLGAQQAIFTAVCAATGLPRSAFDARTMELSLPNSPVRIWFGFVDPETRQDALQAKALCAEVRLQCPLRDVSEIDALARFAGLASRLSVRAAAMTSPCLWTVEKGRVAMPSQSEIEYVFGATTAGLGRAPVTRASAQNFAAALVREFLDVLTEMPWQQAPQPALAGALPQA